MSDHEGFPELDSNTASFFSSGNVILVYRLKAYVIHFIVLAK